jgi:hypothetical protein
MMTAAMMMAMMTEMAMATIMMMATMATITMPMVIAKLMGMATKKLKAMARAKTYRSSDICRDPDILDLAVIRGENRCLAASAATIDEFRETYPKHMLALAIAAREDKSFKELKTLVIQELVDRSKAQEKNMESATLLVSEEA